jgi:hypothetical protein
MNMTMIMTVAMTMVVSVAMAVSGKRSRRNEQSGGNCRPKTKLA